MKKRNITLCAVAMLCMQGYAKADTFILKGDNTCVENYAQMTAAYKSNRPKTPFHLKSGGSWDSSREETAYQS